jgi:ankyrin repeat protein
MALIDAVRDGDIVSIKLLIEQGGTDVNRENWNGRTALFYAIDDKRVDICKFLLDHGAAVNKKYCGTTPLMLAIFKDSIDIIKLLLLSGANLNDESNFRMTALDYAFAFDKLFIARILCWRGAKCSDHIITNIDLLLLLIYYRVIPRDILREIHTKWIL